MLSAGHAKYGLEAQERLLDKAQFKWWGTPGGWNVEAVQGLMHQGFMVNGGGGVQKE